MGRRSEMTTLVERIEASQAARERAKVILLTLSRQWSVEAGCTRLGVKRTRFQDLRRRMIRGAVAALEEKSAGRPPSPRVEEPAEVCSLRQRVQELEHELRCRQVELEIVRGGVADAVARRLAAREARR